MVLLTRGNKHITLSYRFDLETAKIAETKVDPADLASKTAYL
jgi:hypothetical protein